MDTNRILDLVAKMQQGDQESFALLYEEFSDRIYKYIRIKLPSDQEAEDVLQEVFIKTWQGSKKLQLDGLNLSAWLYKIAGNTINDHYRKSYRRPQTISLDPDIDIPANDDTSLNTERNSNAKEIQKVLKELPTNYRQVIELRFFQDFTIEETAKIMGKTSVGVRVLQHRATKKLEKIYKLYERQAKTIL